MNGLEASVKIEELSGEISALDTAISRLAMDRDFHMETAKLRALRERLDKEKSNLQEKLRSFTV